MSVKKIHFIIVAIVISGLFIIGTQLFYKHQQNDLRSRQHEKLQAIARLKASQLTQWHHERLSEASFFSVNDPYKKEVQNIMLGDHESRKKLKHAFSQILTNNRYKNIFILNRSGNILFSIDPEFKLVDPVTLSFAGEVFRKGEILVTDFYYCNAHREIHFEIIAPVYNDAKEVISVLIFRIDPADYLYPLLQEWPAPNKSAETYIVKVKGDSVYYLNSLMYADNSMLQVAFPLSMKENTAVKAAWGREGIVEGTDYRGEKVLADIKKVPDTSWFIISEIDIREIYADLRRHAVMINESSLKTYLI